MTDNAPDLTSTPPVPSPDLVIQPFREGIRPVSSLSRFLVDTGTRQRVVGQDVHDLLMLLQGAPASWQRLAERYAAATGRDVDVAELCRCVLDRMPADWFEAAPSQSAKHSPFLLQFELLSSRRLAPLTRRLAGLFHWWLAIPVIIGFLAIQVIVLSSAIMQIHQSASTGDMVLLFAGLAVTMLWHELGHLSACARSDGQHGGLGVGLYWVFPAMYAEVSTAWRLPPPTRVLVDIGGLYFQAMSVIAIGVYAILTGDALAFQLVWVVTFTMLHTLNPFFKFDGYWLLSDATGLTNLHAQVRRTAVDMLRRLFGRPVAPAGDRKLRVMVLRVYMLLCGLYLAYVLTFLYGEITLTLQQYPTVLTTAFSQAANAFAVQDIGALMQAFGGVLLASIWPACLVIFSTLICWTLLRRAVDIVTELFVALREVEGPV